MSSNASGANQSNLMSVLFMPCQSNTVSLFLIKTFFNLVYIHIYINLLFHRYQPLCQLCLCILSFKSEGSSGREF